MTAKHDNFLTARPHLCRRMASRSARLRVWLRVAHCPSAAWRGDRVMHRIIVDEEMDRQSRFRTR
jgi:hypothetical protein